MSKANSPMYAQGREDAEADNDRVANGNDPLGPQPPNPDYPWMYLKGYEDMFSPNPPENCGNCSGRGWTPQLGMAPGGQWVETGQRDPCPCCNGSGKE